MLYYKDKVAVVTGCSSGMGAAVAKKLAAAGSHVIGVDRKEPTQEIAEFLPTDLSDRSSILAATEKLPEEVSALFNCAGLSGGAADPQTVLRVNFIGLREFLECSLSHMPTGSAIVSTASTGGSDYLASRDESMELVRTAGFDGAAEWARGQDEYIRSRGGYTVAKEALIWYTMDTAAALAERGIRINCTGPGVTDTPMLEDTIRLYGEERLRSNYGPLARRTTPDEQANVLLFFNSDLAAVVSGQILWSDGGLLSSRAVADYDKEKSG